MWPQAPLNRSQYSGRRTSAAIEWPNFFGVERDRVVLVDRLAVEHRLDRRAVVVGARLIVAAGELGAVAVLPHVEVEPVARRGTRSAEPLPAGRVEGDQVRAAVARAQARAPSRE